ncbi:MAG: D-aminoacyl-tRNA deacylase [Patescibacteria group bacterium]
MRAVIQRVTAANVKISERTIGQIQAGLVVLLGIKNGDTPKDVEYLAAKILNLRIFSNQNNIEFDQSVLDINGEILIVSQFTLYADTKKGRRPSFDAAARGQEAVDLYQQFVAKIKIANLKVETGEFGAMMQVELVNNGPVTIILES